LAAVDGERHAVALVGDDHLQQVGDGGSVFHDQHRRHAAHADRLVSSPDESRPLSSASTAESFGCLQRIFGGYSLELNGLLGFQGWQAFRE